MSSENLRALVKKIYGNNPFGLDSNGQPIEWQAHHLFQPITPKGFGLFDIANEHGG